MLQWIIRARSWHLAVRIGIAAAGVAAATALQLPVEINLPGQPFLLYFVAVAATVSILGRTPGFVAVALSTLASLLFYDPVYSLKVNHAVDLLAVEIYAIVAAVSVEAISTRTRWKEAEARLAEQEAELGLARNSEARLRATFDSATVGIAHIGLDGRWIRVNRALCRILGYPVDELLTKTFQDVTHPDYVAADATRFELLQQGKIESYEVEKRDVRNDGTIIWCKKTVSPVRKGDGSIEYFVSVIEDISVRKEAEMELRENEERFRFSLLQSPLPVCLFDDREQILAISRSWLEQSGYSREELPRLEDWTSRAFGERSGELLERIRQIIIVSAEPEARSAELMIRTKDGRERRWSFVTSRQATQFDGRRQFVCVAQDVTDQRAHEEQIHLLVSEISHRAQNMLSLVQAIARQTAAREPEDFIERFTERIQALAANHDLLVLNEWRGVGVEDLVRSQLALFYDQVGSRIALHGSPVLLNAAAAQAIGLALHELATNAAKYGALSLDAGRVDVNWRFDGDIFTMSWTESKGPPVSPPKRRGFGSTVIDLMVKQTLNGEVRHDYIPSGVAWNLACPAANALERNTLYKNSESSMRSTPPPERNLFSRQSLALTVH
jgi:PAS domain S-box-containing protein